MAKNIADSCNVGHFQGCSGQWARDITNDSRIFFLVSSCFFLVPFLFLCTKSSFLRWKKDNYGSFRSQILSKLLWQAGAGNCSWVFRKRSDYTSLSIPSYTHLSTHWKRQNYSHDSDKLGFSLCIMVVHFKLAFLDHHTQQLFSRLFFC